MLPRSRDWILFRRKLHGVTHNAERRHLTWKLHSEKHLRIAGFFQSTAIHIPHHRRSKCQRAKIRADDLKGLPCREFIAQRQGSIPLWIAVRHNGANLPLTDIAGVLIILPGLAIEKTGRIAPVRDMLHLIAPDRVDRLPGGDGIERVAEPYLK